MGYHCVRSWTTHCRCKQSNTPINGDAAAKQLAGGDLQRDDYGVVLDARAALAFGAQQAHDLEVPPVHADRLADRITVGKEPAGLARPQHRHVGSLLAGVEKAAGGEANKV